MRKHLATAIIALPAVVLFAACSSKTPAPVVAVGFTADAGVTTPGDAGPAPTTDAGTAAAPADAGSSPPFFTGDAGLPAAAAALGEAALDAAIDLAITTGAAKAAPKMDKEGQPGRATLKEGEHFGMMINLAPGRCYTIIGNSPTGQVDKLDLKLFGPAPLLTMEAGKSGAADKNMPVIGKGTTALCPVLPVAVPYKVDVVATKGAGRIGVHVFSRAK